MQAMTFNKLVGTFIYHKCLLWLSRGHGEHAIGTTEQVTALKDYLEANDFTLESEDIITESSGTTDDVNERVLSTALSKPESIEFFGCMDTGSFLLVVRYRGFLRKIKFICIVSKNEIRPSMVLVKCIYMNAYNHCLYICHENAALKPLNDKYRLLYNPNNINDNMFIDQLKDKWKAIGTITYKLHDLPEIFRTYPDTNRHYTYTRSVTLYKTKAGKIVAKSDTSATSPSILLAPGFYNALVETVKDNSLDIVKTFIDQKYVMGWCNTDLKANLFAWVAESKLPQARRFMSASKYLIPQFMLEADITGGNKEEVLKALAGYIFREISNDDRSN